MARIQAVRGLSGSLENHQRIIDGDFDFLQDVPVRG